MSTPLRSALDATRRARALAMSVLLVASAVFAPTSATPIVTAAHGSAGVWTVGFEAGGTACSTDTDFTVGSSYESAYGAIQAAVDAASTGDVVLLCDGLYDLTTGIDMTDASTGITIRGETTAGTEVSGGNSVRLFDAGTNDVSFDGLTLRNGAADAAGGGAISGDDITVVGSVLRDNSSGGSGGAIIATGTVTIVASHFAGNLADVSGGTVYAAGDVSSATSTYVDNTSGQNGGAVFTIGGFTSANDDFVGNAAALGGGAYSTTAVVMDGDFTSNTAIDGDGGALYVTSDATAQTSRFTSNRAGTGVGGAIFALGLLSIGSVYHANSANSEGGAINAGTLVSDGDQFTDNRAGGTPPIAFGGAIASFGTVTVSAGTFSGNETLGDSSGGAIAMRYASGILTLHRTSFMDNHAGSGGAIFAISPVELDSVTFSENSAGSSGGAIAAASVTGTNVTFVANTSGDEGGAIHAGDASSSIELTAATFVGNTATGDGDNLWSGGLLSLRSSIVADGDCSAGTTDGSGGNLGTVGTESCGVDATTGDLTLASLADNSGGTETVALLPGSPAIDVTTGTCEVATDQRGTARPQGEGCDVGAFEYVPGETTFRATASPAAPFAGDPVAITVSISSGDGPVVSGRLSVSDGSGTELSSGTSTVTFAWNGRPAGTYTFSVHYSGLRSATVRDYEDTTGTFTVTILPVITSTPAPAIGTTPQTVTFGLKKYAYGGSKALPIALAATASSALPVEYTSTTPTTCRLVGSTLTPLAAGTCTVTATQAGDATYASASVTRSMTVITSAVRITLTQSFAVNGELRLSVPLIVKRGTLVVMSASTGESAMVGKTLEVWAKYGTGSWLKVATRSVGTNLVASYRFLARPDAQYRWRWAGNGILHDQWSTSRRVLGL